MGCTRVSHKGDFIVAKFFVNPNLSVCCVLKAALFGLYWEKGHVMAEVNSPHRREGSSMDSDGHAR